jgi:hypothetical protein
MAKQKTGVTTLRGSKRARQIVVVVLETLSGELGTSEAADKLGVSLSRYYQLETRALKGLLEAVEPRARGPQKTPEKEIQALQAENAQLQKELRRHQALLRAAQRSVGLLSPRSKKTSSQKRGARKQRGSRGKTVRQTLLNETDAKEQRYGETKQSAIPDANDRSERAGA